MVKRASKQDAPISKGINKIALGFTIIETMLFLAIAGLIFAGLVAGTNGAIRRQRYKDSVQGFVDDLRDLYSLVENTQVLNYPGTAKCADGESNEGRGRSNCSVYGIYAIISPNHGNKNTIEAYWVIGTDQSLVRGASSDIEFFKEDSTRKYAQIGTAYMIDGDSALQHINVKSHSILWGADVAIPCNSDFAADIKGAIGTVQGCDAVGSVLSNAQNQVELFIYRSPITGSINTLSSMKVDDTANANDDVEFDQAFIDGENISSVLEDFNHYDVSLCVTGGSGMSYDGGIRMVVIDAYGSNTNAVRLIEADADENKCN